MMTPGDTCLGIVALYLAFGIMIGETDGQGSRYIGCFYDKSSPPTNRALPDLTSCEDTAFCDNFCEANIPYCESAGNMSVTNCVRLCSRQNNVYAGLQAGRQCFCGGEMATYERYGREIEEDRCKSNCSGDVTQSCGNDLRVEVYEIGCIPLASLPPNISVSPPDQNFFKIGENVSISCLEGFVTNRTTLTCLPTGKWSLPPPSCLRDVCAPPDPPLGTMPRGSASQGNTEFYGGDTLLFECLNAGDVTVNISCLGGQWQEPSGSCPETPVSTEVMTTVITEIYTSETLIETKPSAISTTELMTTTDEKATTTSVPIVVTSLNDTSTSSPGNESTTLITPNNGSVHTIPNMLWLIIILGAAMFLFAIIVFIAVVVACRGKKGEGAARASDDRLHIPKMDEMSHMNYAYADTEVPAQNNHSTSVSPMETTTENPNVDITHENNNLNGHEYAKPEITPYVNQSQKVVNEYASPVHLYSNSGMAQVPPMKRVSYSPDIPEPDYEPKRRESYVEMVTKL